MQLDISQLPKLDVGCSDKKIAPEYIGVDPYVPADIKASAEQLPYENNSVGEIYSSHMLEHVNKVMVPIVLAEWYRVLAIGGKLTLWIPDLVWCCKWWLEHQTTGWDMDIIFGNEGRLGENHKTGFSEEIAKTYLRQAGFTIMKFEYIQTHSQQTMLFECLKTEE